MNPLPEFCEIRMHLLLGLEALLLDARHLLGGRLRLFDQFRLR